MPETTKVMPLVRISYDELEAYIELATPGEGETYTVAMLQEALAGKGVVYGINQDVLKRIIDEKLYDREITVAQGTPSKDGTDGYYEYNFDANFDKKPKELPDGSVDYWTVHSIESVVKGQVIAIYHPAVAGEDGTTVKGKTQIAKRGKEQSPIKGKGFERMNDNLTYTATMDGKIEMQNGRIVILPVHELFGNAELTEGNIDFHGDVVIHGGVEAGLVIKASGTVTVDGVVESCTIEAGKDVILRSGMMGGNKAVIRTKGNITAKFFEFTKIECAGDMELDVLMECDVNCEGKIRVHGPKGCIIGGTTRALQGIEASVIGNNAEKKTEIVVGAGKDIYGQIATLEKQIAGCKENLRKVEDGLKQFDILEKERGMKVDQDPRRMALLRVRIKDTALVANYEAELQKLRGFTERARGAVVAVWKAVYPGVCINMGELKFPLRNVAGGVEFYKLPDKIATRPCYREGE